MTPIDVTPTAEMPMPGGIYQTRLLGALGDHESLYELSLELPNLAKSLDSNPAMKAQKFSVSRTVKALKSDGQNGWQMVQLLHSMDRSTIRAIISGTVAYDSHRKEAKWFQTPSSAEEKVPGVYVIGLSREGEGGKFLNIREIQSLVKGIEDYIEGYNVIKQYQTRAQGTSVSLSQSQQSLVEWVKRVDEGPVASKAMPTAAQFIRQDSEVPSVRALASGLLKRCAVTLDPTERVRQVQSPLYVGCSVDLRSRMSKYNRPRLIDMNKPMALTVNIMEALERPLKLSVNVALRIWDLGQLPLAEQLIATLAGSLVYQYGFNATEAGGTGPQSVTEAKHRTALGLSRELVMVHGVSMEKNIGSSLVEVDRRIDFVQKLEEGVVKIAQLGVDVGECEAQMNRLTMLSDSTWEETQAGMKKTEEAMVTRLNEVKEIERQCMVIKSLSKLGYPEAAKGQGVGESS